MILPKLTRRTFLKVIGGLTVTLPGCKGSSDDGTKPSREVPLGLLKDLARPITVFKIEQLVLVQDEVGLGVVGSACTHQTCALSILGDRPSNLSFSCPCHGSQFSRTGQVLNGPAVQNLPWYRLRVDPAGSLYAVLSDVVSADWRLEP